MVTDSEESNDPTAVSAMSDASPQHYDKAPIREAMINIQTERQPSPDAILSIAKRLNGYSGPDEVHSFEAKVAFGASFDTETKSRLVGYRFRSQDNRYVAQFFEGTFAFSQLEPYNDWATLRDQAKSVWRTYAEIVGVGRLLRIALRYVNRFDIPTETGKIELDQYFGAYPELPSQIGGDMTGFIMRAQVPQPDLGAGGVLTITQTGTRPTKPGVVSIILDIDAALVNVAESEVDPWRILEHLRVKKNAIFEACITERARKLIR